MKQQYIYEVSIAPAPIFRPVVSQQPVLSYYSNLQKGCAALFIALEANAWKNQISYSTIYRNIMLKGRYQHTFELSGQRYFQVIIIRKVINPVLNNFGLEGNPQFKMI
jgi:hypothetical protein